MSVQPVRRKSASLDADHPTGRRLTGRRRGSRGGPVFRDFQPHALAIEETPPSPFTGLLLWSLAGLFVVVLVWAYLSHLPIMTTAPGKFVPDAHTKVVQSLNTGTVRGIFVRPGDAVSKGQALVMLDSSVDVGKLVAAGRDLTLDRVQQVRLLRELGARRSARTPAGAAPEMIVLEDHIATSQLAAQRSKLGVDQAQVSEAEANLAGGRATLSEYGERSAQDTQLAKAAQPLVAEGALSGQDYTQLEDQVINDEGQLAAQRQQVGQLSAALVAARKQLQEDARSFESNLYQDLESSVDKGYDLRSQFFEAARDAASDRLRAPVDGTVQTMDVASVGTVVQTGQTVATIVPANAPLVVEVDLPAEDAGFVKVGERTQIKVTSYPFEQYGSIPGKVLWISPTTDSTSTLTSLPEGEDHQPPTQPSQTPQQQGEDQSNGLSPPTLYYRIKIQPDRTWLKVDGQQLSMRSGMTVSVDIKTGQRRVLDFLLDPIVKYAKNGMTVR